jgi:hypothetical protein
VYVHDVGSDRSDDVGIDGYVRYLDDADCFVLESTAGGVRHVAVWPPGTKAWKPDATVAGVRVPDRDPIALGSRVTAAGGYANPATSEIDLPQVAADCLRSEGEFVLIQKIAAVTPPS